MVIPDVVLLEQALLHILQLTEEAEDLDYTELRDIIRKMNRIAREGLQK